MHKAIIVNHTSTDATAEATHSRLAAIMARRLLLVRTGWHKILSSFVGVVMPMAFSAPTSRHRKRLFSQGRAAQDVWQQPTGPSRANPIRRGLARRLCKNFKSSFGSATGNCRRLSNNTDVPYLLDTRIPSTKSEALHPSTFASLASISGSTRESPLQ